MVVVSFYTAVYAGEAGRLLNSLHRFNIPHHVVEFYGYNTWLENVNHKPKFLLNMLDKLQQPIIWIDCDGEVVSYPELFSNLQCDIAATIRRRGRREELLTGTLYLNYTGRVTKFVEEWAKRCESSSIWEQKILQNMLREPNDIVFQELPASYTKIFDAQDMVGDPVIVHHQASRRLKNLVSGLCSR